MERNIDAIVRAAPDEVMAALADLATYPSWLQLVTGAETDNEPQADEGGDETGPAWQVTLRARLGPLARSKRLRMRRTALDERSVRFERDEIDGRTHAAWTLEATVDSIPDGGSQLHLRLHYGGSLWSTPLEVALAAFEDDAAERLDAYLEAS